MTDQAGTRASLDCPVCPNRNLDRYALTCPVCNADLRALQRLRSLPQMLSRQAPPTPAAANAAKDGSWRMIAAAVLLVLVGAALGMVVRTPSGDAGPPAAVAAPPAPVPATEVRPSASPVDEALANTLKAIDGIQLQQLADGVSLRLPIEFGRAGATLPTSARRAVTQVGTALSGTKADIVVEGVTDPRPMRPGARYPTNEALGVARAQSVAAVLREALGSDAPALFLTARTSSAAPERTVVVHVRSRLR